jgi:tRNA pseudouridine38-40 synthase
LVKINTLLPEDIVIHDIFKVKDSAHARFDAVSRSYSYHIHLSKSPFPELSFHYFYKKPQLHILNEAAGLLLKYQDFNTFCKTKTDVTSTICNITKANWIMIDEDHLEFQISADRFLRGMVRLITGMCLDVDRGKLNLDEVRYALENKSRLPRHWSVPALGLFLKDIEYPDTIRENK